MRNDKRLCPQLSPLAEGEQAGLAQNIQLAIQDAIEKAAPKIFGQLEKSMQDIIIKTIDSALVKIKKDVEQAMRKEMEALQQEELKMWCDAEILKIITVEKIFESLD